MLGALSALIPIVTTVLPGLVSIFGTPAAGSVLIKAAEIAETIFGTKDPSQIEAQLKTDTVKLERFRAELSAATASEQAWLADIASARNMQMEAVRAGSGTQWIPVVISGIIFLIFMVAFYLTATRTIAADNAAGQQMVGAIIAAFTSVVGYWLGSSRSSVQKDSAMVAITASAQQSVTAANTAAAAAQPTKMFR